MGVEESEGEGEGVSLPPGEPLGVGVGAEGVRVGAPPVVVGVGVGRAGVREDVKVADPVGVPEGVPPLPGPREGVGAELNVAPVAGGGEGVGVEV